MLPESALWLELKTWGCKWTLYHRRDIITTVFEVTGASC